MSITTRRAFLTVFFCAFMISVFVTDTFGQKTVNEVRGSPNIFPVRLEKYEKQADGTKTAVPVAGAEFQLYQSGKGQIGEVFITDAEGKIEVGLKPGKYYFEETNPGLYHEYDVDGDGTQIRIYEFEVVENSGAVTVITAFNRAVFRDERTHTASVSVTKLWADDVPETRPLSVQVQLYKDGDAYGSPVYLSDGNALSHTWTGLDENAVWTVDEINIPDGYTKTVSGSLEKGFIITNTKTDAKDDGKTVTVSGGKTWEHKGNSGGDYPEYVIVLLKADGETVLQKMIDETNGWAWSFKVDKYGEDGHEIVYTIDEGVTEYYEKEVDGYNLHNRYTHHHNPLDEGGLHYETGDDSNIRFWLILAGVCSVLLVVVVFGGNPRKKRYIPKH